MIIVIATILYCGLAIVYLMAIHGLIENNARLPLWTRRALGSTGSDNDIEDTRLFILAIFWPIGLALLLIDTLFDQDRHA